MAIFFQKKNNRRVMAIIILVIVLAAGFYFLNDFSVKAKEQIKIFPVSFAGDWYNPEKVFSQDLSKSATINNFNNDNSASPILNEDDQMNNPILDDYDLTGNTTSTSESIPVEEMIQKTLELYNFGIPDDFEKNKIQNVQLRFSFAAKPLSRTVPDSKLIIEYQYNGTWQMAGEIIIDKEISNATNGGYFLYVLPIFESWLEMENLKLKFKFIGSDKQSKIYLDAVWLEAVYEIPSQTVIQEISQDIQEIETISEQKQQLEENLGEEQQIQEEPPSEAIEEQQPEQQEENLVFINLRDKFFRDEKPEFMFHKIKKTNLWGKIVSLFQPTTQIQEFSLLGPNNQELSAYLVLLEEGDNYLIRVRKAEDWQPGNYQLKIKLAAMKKIYSGMIDFEWLAPLRQPKKVFSFAVAGVPLKTTVTTEIKNKKNIKSNTAININISDDGENGSIINLNGNCSKDYFVVLLYRQAEDYEKDPASFIYNKAFPCQDNRYEYSFNDLPLNLENGTYYLLVAEQGKKDSWQPITAIQPIRISIEEIK